ncbi:MAG: metal-dependent hydrolase [Candidatus Nanoarchaeia archaeon]
MRAATHISFGIFLFGILASIFDIKPSAALISTLSLASLLPDIDHQNSFFGLICSPVSKYIDKKFGHRTITHSFLFLFICALCFLPTAIFNKYIWLSILIGVFSHFIADGMNISGVPLFWPSPKIFYFIPERYLISTGDKEELFYFLAFTSGASVTIGTTFIGFKQILHFLLPSFESTFYLYSLNCDGLGEKTLCQVKVDQCGEYCGEISGYILGIYNNKLIVWNETQGYALVEKSYVLKISLKKIKNAKILVQTYNFYKTPLEIKSFDEFFVTLRGEFNGNFVCEDASQIYPVFQTNQNLTHISLNHILLSDFQKKNCKGFIQDAWLEYKIRKLI